MGYLHYKGYTGSAEYEEDGNYFHGKVLGLRRDGIIYEGASAEELKRDFEESINEYIEECKEIGKEPEKPYSGKTVIRMGSQLHEKVAQRAGELGLSLNEFVNQTLRAAVL